MKYKIRVEEIIKKKGVFKTILYLSVKLINKVITKIILNLLKYNIFVNENRICFQSKPDFSDNSRFLFEYMVKHSMNDQYEIIWLVRNPGKYKDIKIKNVKFIQSYSINYNTPTLKALYFEQTSKYVFYTHSALHVPKNKTRQLFVNLWHGCGYKASNNVNNKQKLFDYVLVPGNLFIEPKSVFFNCPRNNVLPLGYPRYDLLFSEKEQPLIIKEFLKGKTNDLKVVMWMPTFRKTSDLNYPEEKIEYDFPLPLLKSYSDLIELNKQCADNDIMLLIKKHRNQVDFKISSDYLSNIIFITDDTLEEHGIELYSLLKYTEALITDYSSIAIDYLLLDKPIGFALEDYEMYKNTRGFVFDEPKQYMPGNHLYNATDLFDFIKSIGNQIDNFKNERSLVKKEAHNLTGDYSMRILQYFKII